MANRALLVVDMQNGFCHPDGSFPRIGIGLDGAEAAVSNAAVAVAQARRAAIPVVFTRHLYRPGRPDEGAALIRNSPALAGVNGLAAGFWDAEVMDELGCGPRTCWSTRYASTLSSGPRLSRCCAASTSASWSSAGWSRTCAWRPRCVPRSCATSR
jgi:hypothetical protein